MVAARPVMRLSVDGGRSYPRARVLAAGRPAVPAAVATFDAAGRAPNVVFDLDVSKGGPARVAADAEGLAALLAGSARPMWSMRAPAAVCMCMCRWPNRPVSTRWRG